MNTAAQVALDAEIAVELKRAVADQDEVHGRALANKLFQTSPEWILRNASPDEIEVRRMAHEILDDFLRQIVFADDFEGTEWRSLSFPVQGAFVQPILIANARWLRMFGSSLPDQELEELCPKQLAAMNLQQQAKSLGRFCSVNDGAREVDYRAIHDALDPRLRPSFGHWAAGIGLASPDNLGTKEAAARQVRLAKDFVQVHQTNCKDLAGSTLFANLHYNLCYRADMDIKALATILNGQLTRRMLEQFGKPDLDSSEGALTQGLKKNGKVVLCPNWSEEHVAYRCMAGSVEGIRGQSMKIVMPHETGTTRTISKAWEAETLAFQLDGEHHFLAALGGVAQQIKRAKTDFLFYPEVTPNNPTAYLATQRLARVQAAGYGYPITTGSPHMDYFIGGSEVEGDGSDYTEQLILLPGLGVSTTEPPRPSRKRQRGLSEDTVRVASITSFQKLTQGLLETWEAILGDQPHVSMDLFPAVTQGQASSLIPALARGIRNANIDLNLLVPRTQILDTLEDADLYLDSFPYGGFNSLVEVLCAGCPVVTLEGDHARHRFGAAMLRRLGLPNFLIAKTEAEFIAAARRLIADAPLRIAIRSQIGTREHVLKRLDEPDIAQHFAAAVELMTKLGPRKGRPQAPIHISADQPAQNCA